MPLVDNYDMSDDVAELDLICPACSANLILDETFLAAQVCGACHRHFSMGARDRISLYVDPGTFDEFHVPNPGTLEDASPASLPSAERIAEMHDRQVVADAVVTGRALIGGTAVAVVVLDDHLVGGVLGTTLVEKIVDGFAQAVARKLPVVIVLSGGAPSPTPGPLSVVQPGRLASAFAQVHLADLPIVGILAHPVSRPNYAALAAHCDLLWAEPGARIGTSSTSGVMWQTADDLLQMGWVDAVVDRLQARSRLGEFLTLVSRPGSIRPPGRPSPAALSVPVTPSASGTLDIATRPDGRAMKMALFTDIVELRGDRVAGDCAAIETSLARFESLSVASVVLHDVPSEQAGIAARKMARLCRLASRLERPVVILIDEVGEGAATSPSIADGQAIAQLSTLLAVVPVPVVVIGLRRIATSLAYASFTGDRQFLLSNARLVSNREVEVSLLHQAGRLPSGSGSISARECERLGLIDAIVDEPAPGAHVDPVGTANALRSALSGALAELAGVGSRRLIDARYRRQRELGLSTPAGRAAVRSELWEIQEWQRSLGRSLDDWRERWDQFRASREHGRRMELPDMMTRLRSRRDEILSRTGRGERAGMSNAHRDEASGQ